MIDYVNEAGEVTRGTNFGESYDKEVALREEAEKDGRLQGIEIGKNEKTLEIVKKMLSKNIDTALISEVTGIKEENIELIKKDSYDKK